MNRSYVNLSKWKRCIGKKNTASHPSYPGEGSPELFGSILTPRRGDYYRSNRVVTTMLLSEMDLMAELQRLSSLEKQMEKWEKEIESELTVTQRISEKTMYDKNKLIEEKRKMVGREVNHCGKLTTEIENFGIARCGESQPKIIQHGLPSILHNLIYSAKIFGKS